MSRRVFANSLTFAILVDGVVVELRGDFAPMAMLDTCIPAVVFVSFDGKKAMLTLLAYGLPDWYPPPPPP